MGKKYWGKMELPAPSSEENPDKEAQKEEVHKKREGHINAPMRFENLKYNCFGRAARIIGHLFLLLLPLILPCCIYCFLLVSAQADACRFPSANSTTYRRFTCLYC